MYNNDMPTYTGTITQTSPAITQSATVAQNILEETATAIGFPSELADTETLSEYALAYGPIDAIIEQATASVVNASEDITFDVITSLDETATASNSFVAEDFVNIGSTARITDIFTAWYAVTLTDTANVLNTFAFSRSYDLTETASVTGTIDPGITYIQAVEATASITDTFYPGQAAELSYALNAADTWTDNLLLEETLASVVNAVEDLVPTTTATSSLSFTVQGSESFTFSGTYSEVISNSAGMSDWLWAKDFGSIAWVLNTQSGGLTSYDNFGFSSIAFHDGVLYATSPDGLYALGADDDDGRDIAALYKTGFLRLGSDSKKRISDIFVGYTGTDLECDVETYDKQVYTYPMEYREADAPHNSRIKVGRGLSSKHWRFGFRNTGGADFQIQDIDVKLAVSKRRI